MEAKAKDSKRREPSTEIVPVVRQETLPTFDEVAIGFVEQLASFRELAEIVVSSGFLPKAVDTPEKALTLMLKGRELGISPMLAMQKLYVVDGQPGMAAELALALAISRADVKVEWVRREPLGATVRILRPGWEPHEESFTIEDAKKVRIGWDRQEGRAKYLHEKDNWQNWPGAMCGWRAVLAGLRAVAPDVLAGMYSIEELAPDTPIDPKTGAPIGEVVYTAEVEEDPETAAQKKTDAALDALERELDAEGDGLSEEEANRVVAIFKETGEEVEVEGIPNAPAEYGFIRPALGWYRPVVLGTTADGKILAVPITEKNVREKEVGEAIVEHVGEAKEPTGSYVETEDPYAAIEDQRQARSAIRNVLIRQGVVEEDDDGSEVVAAIRAAAEIVWRDDPDSVPREDDGKVDPRKLDRDALVEILRYLVESAKEGGLS